MAALAAEGSTQRSTTRAHNQFDTEDRGLQRCLRLSPHYYTTEAEIDRAVEVIASL